MYAVFIEVNADESNTDEAREMLPEMAVPIAREAGAKSGYWLAPQGGRGLSVIVFDSEDEARQAADRFKVGEPAGPSGVTFRTVEVREVLANL